MIDQENLFGPTPEQPPFDAAAAAAHIANHAPANPYAEQEKRAKQIDDLRNPVTTDDVYIVGPDEHEHGRDKQWRIPEADKVLGREYLKNLRPNGL